MRALRAGWQISVGCQVGDLNCALEIDSLEVI